MDLPQLHLGAVAGGSTGTTLAEAGAATNVALAQGAAAPALLSSTTVKVTEAWSWNPLPVDTLTPPRTLSCGRVTMWLSTEQATYA